MFGGGLYPLAFGNPTVSLLISDERDGKGLSKLDIDIRPKPVMTPVVKTNGLNHWGFQTPMVCYAGCIQGESQGAGSQGVQMWVLMRFSFWHDNSCVA